MSKRLMVVLAAILVVVVVMAGSGTSVARNERLKQRVAELEANVLLLERLTQDADQRIAQLHTLLGGRVEAERVASDTCSDSDPAVWEEVSQVGAGGTAVILSC